MDRDITQDDSLSICQLWKLQDSASTRADRGATGYNYTSGSSESSSRSWTQRMHACTVKRLANSSSMQTPSKRNYARVLLPANPRCSQSAISIYSGSRNTSRIQLLIASDSTTASTVRWDVPSILASVLVKRKERRRGLGTLVCYITPFRELWVPLRTTPTQGLTMYPRNLVFCSSWRGCPSRSLVLGSGSPQ